MRKALIFILLAFGLVRGLAQCPGCVVNYSCGAGGTTPLVCPDSLATATVMELYHQDVTLFVPSQMPYPVPGLGTVTVTVAQVQIMGISGLPYGINWSTGSPGNTFFPGSNPPNSQFGCIQLCGTPVLEGTYQLTASIMATGAYGSLTQTQQMDVDFELIVLPGTSNPVFSMSAPTGCAPHTSQFSALIASNGDPSYQYAWNFGNGNSSTTEFPPAQTYTSPGSYPISLTTQIVDQQYLISSVQVNGVGCNDNFFTYQEAPDLFIVIKQGTTPIYTSAVVNNVTTTTFSFGPLELGAQTYSIQVWDDDVIDSDDNCGIVSFQGNVPGTLTLTSGGLTLTFAIQLNTSTQSFSANDTILVLASPVVELGPNQQFTGGEAQVLNAQNPGCTYLWSTGQTTQSITAAQSGTYAVTVTHPQGCQAMDARTLLIGPDNPALVTQSVTCAGYSNGKIDLTYLGGPSPAYVWSNGATTQDIQDLAAGLYSVTLTDGASQFMASAQVGSPAPIQITALTTPTNCDTCTTGTIDLTLTGGTSPYSVGWSNGASTQDIMGLGADTFLVYVLDDHQCVAWDTLAIEVVSQMTQTIALPSGWSVFSTFINPANPSLPVVLSGILPQVKIVKSGNGGVYWPQFGINSIGGIQIGRGYQINVTGAASLAITGVALVPQLTPISIPTGWSIIGYLRQSPGYLPLMLQSLLGKIVIVKNGAGQVYWAAVNLNSIGNMVPGQGYLLSVNQAGTLLYPAN